MRKILVLLGLTSVLTLSFGQSEAADKGGWLEDQITGCEVFNDGALSGDEGVSWSGACSDGKAIGRGTAIFWDDAGLEGRYDGDLKSGKAEGHGTAWVRNDDVGGFDRYQGEFSEGELTGEVTITSAAGYVFTGSLNADGSGGEGDLQTPEGWLLRGKIKDGQPIGPAFVYYETEEGELYFGDIEDNARNGFGILINADESSYLGDFVDGFPSGMGVYEGASGDTFVGQFETGAPNGTGTATDVEGTTYQGRFIEGVADGLILVTKQDGSQSTETWKDGGKVD